MELASSVGTTTHYLRPSRFPPGNGAPILTIDDLRDDLLLEVHLSDLRAISKKKNHELYYTGITTPAGYRLLALRSYRPPAESLERFSLDHYPLDWREPFLQSAEIFRDIDEKLRERYPDGYEERIVPEKTNIYRGFTSCPFTRLKVVILGQDPYTNDIGGNRIAIGKAFAILRGIKLLGLKVGTSLINIFTEIKRSYPEFEFDPYDGELDYWSEQGVLLLNSSLTGERGYNERANAHKGWWRNFIYNIFTYIMTKKQHCVFVALGAEAKRIIDSVEPGPSFPFLHCAHPSSKVENAKKPFAGSGIFKQINEELTKRHLDPIDWNLKRRE